MIFVPFFLCTYRSKYEILLARRETFLGLPGGMPINQETYFDSAMRHFSRIGEIKQLGEYRFLETQEARWDKQAAMLDVYHFYDAIVSCFDSDDAHGSFHDIRNPNPAFDITVAIYQRFLEAYQDFTIPSHA
ncbi:MAG TPA: hypothetical protein VMR73_02095 [Candidatus Paceibacterota bacterium]|nr:hypothetical protein [Candidatus Paceibacterota bacterium]